MIPAEYFEDIRLAVDCLRRGGVILYPTDTVWGIGCDATCSDAVRRVFEIKRRADAKALITLVGSVAALERVVDPDAIPDVAYELIEFSTRPTTIVYDRASRVSGIAPELLAPDGSIGVRVTSEAFSRALCEAFRRPLVSTSANVSGEAAPETFAAISREISGAVDYGCTSRRDEPTADRRPSVVMRLDSSGMFKVLRS